MQDILVGQSETVESILARHFYLESEIIEILQEIQANEGYLPEAGLVHVAKRLRLPLSRVYGIATFFKSFHLAPRGRHTIQVCTGVGCLAKGAWKLLARLRNELGIQPGATTEDRMFNLETVRCVGCCGRAPVVVAAGRILCGSEYDEVRSALDDLRNAEGRKESGE